jgi:hypothetical protein
MDGSSIRSSEARLIRPRPTASIRPSPPLRVEAIWLILSSKRGNSEKTKPRLS